MCVSSYVKVQVPIVQAQIFTHALLKNTYLHASSTTLEYDQNSNYINK